MAGVDVRLRDVVKENAQNFARSVRRKGWFDGSCSVLERVV